MPKRVSQEEINKMIDVCLGVVKRGSKLTEAQDELFARLFHRIGKERGLPYPDYFPNADKADHSAEAFLLDAENLELPKTAKHRSAILQLKSLLVFESSIERIKSILRHLNEAKYSTLRIGHEGLPLEQRWQIVKNAGGIDMKRLERVFSAHKRVYELYDEADFIERDSENARRLKARVEKLQTMLHDCSLQLVSQIRTRMEREAQKPPLRTRLSGAPTAGSDARKRELETLAKYREARERQEKAKKKKSPPRSGPRRPRG